MTSIVIGNIQKEASEGASFWYLQWHTMAVETNFQAIFKLILLFREEKNI